MAEGEDSGQDRTEEPTEKRLREAREQGQVPRSRELSTAAVFGAAAITFFSLGGWMGQRATTWLSDYLSGFHESRADTARLSTHFFVALGDLLWIAMPIAGACVLAGILAPLMLGGLSWSNKPLTPDFSKLDPIKGLKRIYGREGLAELLRSLLRVAVIGGFGSYTILGAAPELVALMHEPLEAAVGHGFRLALSIVVAMAIGLLLIALLDVPYQLWSHRQKLLMTRQQLRDEMKESEGSPEVKGKIRRLQQEVSQRRMMEAIPQADAVLVNPTHYAVAVEYKAGQMRAPTVVAKGVDEVAAIIRKLAEKHRVPIVSSPPLARSLYRQVPIGREIPVNLYAAVAQVLTYVYQLRQWRRHGGRYPDMPPIQVPDDPR